MSIDWDRFERDLDSIVDEAAARTDERLASMISSVTRLTYEEVIELFPDPAAVQKLAKLMKVIKSAESRNSKISNIISNTEEFAGTMLTLLQKLV